MSTSYEPWTVQRAADCLRKREVSSVELVTEAINAADAWDERIGSFTARFTDTALAAARCADREIARRGPKSPLHGIPLGIKDMLNASEAPTTAQSAILPADWGRGSDAFAVARLRDAGAIIMGKTSTMEFAVGTPDAASEASRYPFPRNPWDVTRWTGGSSSGSASGVAVGMFLGALGTDTAGSIRIPSAFCGVTGLKPTYGRVSRSGCVPLGFTLDHVGPIARTARDCGLILGVISGYDPDDPSSVDTGSFEAGADDLAVGLKGVTIGADRLADTPPDCLVPEVSAAFEEALTVLESLGASIVDVKLPLYQEMVTANMVTLISEGAAYHMTDLRNRWSEYGPARRVLGFAPVFSGADYVQAQRVRRVGQEALSQTLANLDAIVTPTLGLGAVAAEDAELIGIGPKFAALLTPYWNAAGNPVVSVPMGFQDDRLPLGLQIAGAPWEEETVLRIGNAFQSCTSWHERVPSRSEARR